MKQKRAGGKAAPYDHTQVEESELSAVFEETARMVANEPRGALTPMRITAMTALVKNGVPIPVAATSLGCGSRVKDWTDTARRHAAKGMTPGFGDGESPYLLFLQEMDSARAFAEATLVQAIYMAAPNDWKAAAWLLERRASKRWHLQSKIELTAKSGEKLQIETFSTEKLLQMAKGLVDGDQIKETKALPADVQDGEIVEEP